MNHHPATLALIRAAVDLERHPETRQATMRDVLDTLQAVDDIKPGRQRVELLLAFSEFAKAAGAYPDAAAWLDIARGTEVLAAVEAERRYDA